MRTTKPAPSNTSAATSMSVQDSSREAQERNSQIAAAAASAETTAMKLARLKDLQAEVKAAEAELELQLKAEAAAAAEAEPEPAEAEDKISTLTAAVLSLESTPEQIADYNKESKQLTLSSAKVMNLAPTTIKPDWVSLKYEKQHVDVTINLPALQGLSLHLRGQNPKAISFDGPTVLKLLPDQKTYFWVYQYNPKLNGDQSLDDVLELAQSKLNPKEYTHIAKILNFGVFCYTSQTNGVTSFRYIGNIPLKPRYIHPGYLPELEEEDNEKNKQCPIPTQSYQGLQFKLTAELKSLVSSFQPTTIETFCQESYGYIPQDDEKRNHLGAAYEKEEGKKDEGEIFSGSDGSAGFFAYLSIDPKTISNLPLYSPMNPTVISLRFIVLCPDESALYLTVDPSKKYDGLTATFDDVCAHEECSIKLATNANDPKKQHVVHIVHDLVHDGARIKYCCEEHVSATDNLYGLARLKKKNKLQRFSLEDSYRMNLEPIDQNDVTWHRLTAGIKDGTQIVSVATPPTYVGAAKKQVGIPPKTEMFKAILSTDILPNGGFVYYDQDDTIICIMQSKFSPQGSIILKTERLKREVVDSLEDPLLPLHLNSSSWSPFLSLSRGPIKWVWINPGVHGGPFGSILLLPSTSSEENGPLYKLRLSLEAEIEFFFDLCYQETSHYPEITLLRPDSFSLQLKPDMEEILKELIRLDRNYAKYEEEEGTYTLYYKPMKRRKLLQNHKDLIRLRELMTNPSTAHTVFTSEINGDLYSSHNATAKFQAFTMSALNLNPDPLHAHKENRKYRGSQYQTFEQGIKDQTGSGLAKEKESRQHDAFQKLVEIFSLDSPVTKQNPYEIITLLINKEGIDPTIKQGLVDPFFKLSVNSDFRSPEVEDSIIFSLLAEIHLKRPLEETPLVSPSSPPIRFEPFTYSEPPVDGGHRDRPSCPVLGIFPEDSQVQSITVSEDSKHNPQITILIETTELERMTIEVILLEPTILKETLSTETREPNHIVETIIGNSRVDISDVSAQRHAVLTASFKKYKVKFKKAIEDHLAKTSHHSSPLDSYLTLYVEAAQNDPLAFTDFTATQLLVKNLGLVVTDKLHKVFSKSDDDVPQHLKKHSMARIDIIGQPHRCSSETRDTYQEIDIHPPYLYLEFFIENFRDQLKNLQDRDADQETIVHFLTNHLGLSVKDLSCFFYSGTNMFNFQKISLQVPTLLIRKGLNDGHFILATQQIDHQKSVSDWLAFQYTREKVNNYLNDNSRLVETSPPIQDFLEKLVGTQSFSWVPLILSKSFFVF